MLIEKLRADLKQAMKDKDSVKKSVIQLLISAIRNKEIDEKITVTPEDEIAILSRELKQTKESLELIVNSPEGHEEVIAEYNKKIEFIKSYMPKQMSEEEVEKIIRGEIEKLNLQTVSPKEKGLIMKNIMPVLKGKTDGKTIDTIVNKIINS